MFGGFSGEGKSSYLIKATSNDHDMASSAGL